ncbi:MAG: MFS transporter [Polyangiales bacterium]
MTLPCHVRDGMGVTARDVFAHREFRLAMLAKLLSVIGSQMQAVAIGWQVYEITRRPLDLGLVGLAQFVPAASLSLWAGHVADRFDRKRILLLFHAGMALSALALFWLARMGHPPIAAIWIVGGVLGVLRTFAGPANQSLLPHLVPAELFPRAVGWSSSVWQIAAIGGPFLGGVFYAAGGNDYARAAQLVYAAAAVFSVLAFAAMAAMQIVTPPREKKAADWETLSAGVRYVWRAKLVLGSISLDLFAVLFGGAVALLPIYARDILHVGPTGLGALRSAPAAGAACTALFLAQRPLGKNLGPIMFVSVAIFGAATIVFGLSRSFAVSLLALFVVGASDMVSVVIRQLVVQLSTPDEMRGRVSAVNLVFVGASNELGEFESGLTAAWLGVVPAVVVGGIGTLAVVGLWTLLFPGLRRLDSVGDLRSGSTDDESPRATATGTHP